MNFITDEKKSSIIKVIGVGGGGCNAINHMYKEGITDVDFIICNTDIQVLAKSPIPVKVQLGASLTEGLGAGNNPERGKQSAKESLEEISTVIDDNTKMVFITAGMGGGTGTGATPEIAKVLKERNILTIAIVTIPFLSEGPKRLDNAINGLLELQKYVDSLLIINNEKLIEIYGDLSLSEAFAKADDVLTLAVKGIAEIITVPGTVNVDFADVKSVMRNSETAIMGTGTESGESRAIKALERALISPLLNNNDIQGAKNILLNISYGQKELSMSEFGEITSHVQNIAGSKANLIYGTCFNETLTDEVNITVIATGFKAENILKQKPSVTISEKTEKNKVDFTINQKNIDFDKEKKKEEIRDKLYSTDDKFEKVLTDDVFKKVKESIEFLNTVDEYDEDILDDLDSKPAINRQHIDKYKSE